MDVKEMLGRDGLAQAVDGSVMMVYTGETPWHSLGTKFESLMTTRQALMGAKFPRMMEIPATYTLDGKLVNIPDRKVIIREDNKTYISTVGINYKVSQFEEALADTMDGLMGEGGAFIETAGVLRNGATGWMQARLPGDIIVPGTKGKDVLQRFILASTSHDGTSNATYREIVRRVVCGNTHRRALNDKHYGLASVRHSKNMPKNLSKVGSILYKANEYYKVFADSVGLLASKGTTDQTVKDFLMELIPDKADAKHKTRSENIRAEIMGLAVNGRGQDMDGVKGTLWALYNGVTEYVDYHRGTRGESDAVRAENRLESVFFGSGAELKDSAFELAVKMAS